jgi:SprB repeat/CHU_C Type IX secretion signal domain/PKD domain
MILAVSKFFSQNFDVLIIQHVVMLLRHIDMLIKYPTMHRLIFTFLTATLTCCSLQAQVTNDECANPIVISDVTNFCSPTAAFSNNGATPSSYGPADCFTPGTGDDVWFAFTAEATDVTITVRGNTAASPGGTLADPQVALYFGTCGGTINELECQSAPGNTNVAEAYQGGLFVGSTYLIRIQGANSQNGTFQICINNYNPPVDPQSDCPEAAILCDKSSFNVANVVGFGNFNNELNDADCFGNGSPTNYESNSTWFVWQCSQSGTLEFTLTPNNGPDDLDFVLFRLPNGIGDCSNKQILRCMASGQNGGFNPPPDAACLGPTGLRAGENDISEDAGCSDAGDNAWLSPLDMVAGETYVLCVNNFSASGNGFSVEFGGTGQFLGPDAEFTTIPNAVCIGTQVQVKDASTFPIGQITEWNWSFGANALPGTATGVGPHNVTFNQSGQQSVVLTVKTDLGCKVTHIQTVTVFPDVEVDTILAAPDCNGGTNGVIEITNIISGTPPYQFSWNNSPFTSNNKLEGLPVGFYDLVVKDANNCLTNLTIEVKEKELTVDPDITPPLCNGDNNAIVELTVTNGTPPYQFNWGSGFQSNNTQGGFTAGTYTVLGLDGELCKGTYVFTIEDHPPLALSLDTTDITCFGADDGIIKAMPSGGVGGYTYLWSNGQTTATATNLPSGQYSVTVRDANDCIIIGAGFVTEPPDLNVVILNTVDLLCGGVPTGSITVSGSGGRDPYRYGLDGVRFGENATLGSLAAGTYWVKIKDISGCIDSVQATLTEPPPVTVVASPTDTLINLGYEFQVTTITGPAGSTMAFMWTPADGSINCSDCPNPVITGTNDQAYIVKVTDVDGCMDTDTVFVRVNKQRPIYFPNAISPGTPFDWAFTGFSGPAGDQINLLRVFDRWGSLVFETRDIPLNDLTQGWDGTINGKPADLGVYVWYARVGFVDGIELEYKGDVSVIR